MKQEEYEAGDTGNTRNRKQVTWEARGIEGRRQGKQEEQEEGYTGSKSNRK
jgi:hypothetical protein